jgi:ribosomal-protein-alanine N-acetyltransferase
VNPDVYLRHPRADDLQPFIELSRGSARLCRGLASPLVDPEKFAQWVARSESERFRGFVVCRVGDGQMVGVVNLSEIVGGVFRSAYMGYHVFAPFARQGYMTRMMPVLLAYVFTTLRLHRVEANIQPHNTASISLVRRAGFQREGYSPRYLKVAGRWRDHERWAITVEAWRRARRTAPAPASKAAGRNRRSRQAGRKA